METSIGESITSMKYMGKTLPEVMGKLAMVLGEVCFLKKVVSVTYSVGVIMAKFPKPKVFGVARDAKELESFLWDMEYFKAI